MKNKAFSLIALIFAILMSYNYAGAQVKKYNLNDEVAKSSITFYSNAVLEDISGSVENGKFTSSINFDASNPQNTSGNVSLEIKGMKTGMDSRDKHMYGSDWLEAGKYPNLTYEVTKLDKVKSNSAAGKTTINAVALGKFTMHGVTKEMSVPVVITYIPESDATRKRAAGDFLNVEGKLDVKWRDYGVKGKKGTEEKVGETINCTFKLFYNNK